MTESMFVRARRLAASGLDTGLTLVERASGEALMREALRDMDAVIARAEEQRAAAQAIVPDTERRDGALAGERARLDEDIRYALGRDRRDLAEAMVSRQIDIDAERASQVERNRAALAAVTEIERGIASLRVRRAAMADGATADATDTPTLDPKIARRATDAEAAFARAATLAGKSPADGAVTGEIETLRRADLVAERLAAIATPPKSKAKRSRG